MNRSLQFLLLALSLVIVACSKKIVAPIQAPAAPAPTLSLEVEAIDFEYFHGKARMILRDANKEREVKATIRIRKDSVIWMTFNVIGIQGGKALINHDSITIVSNVDKEYYVFDYKELSKRFNFNISYNVIQSAMLGNLIMPRSADDDIKEESSVYVLKQHSGTVDVMNFINAANMKLEKVEMKETNTSNSLTINYSNFQPVGNKTFPYNGTINLFYKAAAGLFNTTIIFDYNKAEVGSKELKFPFNIPKRYERR
jgi:hypothetical protein